MLRMILKRCQIESRGGRRTTYTEPLESNRGQVDVAKNACLISGWSLRIETHRVLRRLRGSGQQGSIDVVQQVSSPELLILEALKASARVTGLTVVCSGLPMSQSHIVHVGGLGRFS